MTSSRYFLPGRIYYAKYDAAIYFIFLNDKTVQLCRDLGQLISVNEKYTKKKKFDGLTSIGRKKYVHMILNDGSNCSYLEYWSIMVT